MIIFLSFFSFHNLVLEFQTRFWSPKPAPARASVRGLEFDSGPLEAEARRFNVLQQAPAPEPPSWETAEVSQNNKKGTEKAPKYFFLKAQYLH